MEPGGIFLATPGALGLTANHLLGLLIQPDRQLLDLVEKTANEELCRLANIEPAGNC